jgi:hypothetical protein
MSKQSTLAQLEVSCRAVAAELENVGKKPCRYCGECKNWRNKESADPSVEDAVPYCTAKSEYDEDENSVTDYYWVSMTDEIEEHGDWNIDLGRNESCADFDAIDGEEFEKYENFVEYKGDCYFESMYEWLNHQLDIEYTITARGEYKHGIVVTGTGGPHIEVDTKAREVKGYRGSDSATAFVGSSAIADLDEALEEMYESTR